MKIEGLPIDNGGVNKITDRRTPKTAPAGRPELPDTVELTGGIGRKELLEMSADTPVEFPVRESLIEEVKRRISANAYDDPGISGKTAERLLESPALSDTAAAAAAPRDAERTERVGSAADRARADYYNRPDVLETTAAHLLNALGLGNLYGE